MTATSAAAEGPRCADDGALPRAGLVEVSMDLTRLVEALGPDVLFQVPGRFRGTANTLSVRALLSAQAAAMPGFVAEIGAPDPLRRPRFLVEGEHERRFIGEMDRLIREILLESRPILPRSAERPG
jgi:hypothetical protein